MTIPARTTLLLLLCLVLGPTSVVASSHARAPHRQGRVLIVGGGLAGLVTAYELGKAGIPVEVLEAADRLGGRVATARYEGGLQGEYGMQEIWQKNPLFRITHELGLTTSPGEDAWSSFIIDHKLYPFIQDTREEFFRATFNPSERQALHATLAELERLYLEATRKGLTKAVLPLQATSFDDWLKARHLPPRVDAALRLTIEAEMAATSDQLSALSAILEWRTFLFGGEKAYHINGGNDRLIRALARHIHGPILLNARVTEVRRRKRADGTEDVTVTYRQGSDVKTVHGGAVVMTVPWFLLHRIQFEPDLTASQRKSIATLGLGHYEVVHIRLSRAAAKLWKTPNGETPFPFLSGGPLGIIYGPRRESAHPTSHDMLFELLVYGFEAQAYDTGQVDRSKAVILAHLDEYWPGISSYVRDVQFYSYHPAAIPFWPPGRSPMDALAKAVRAPRDGLFLAGDWTVSSPSDDAASTALRATRQVEAYLGHARKAKRRR